MLILTRRIGETLCIGDDIQITIRAVNGNQVKLGITAPDDVSILRKEIWVTADGIDLMPSDRAAYGNGINKW